MKVRAGSAVELHYELLDDEGNVVESTAEEGPVRYVHGAGEILPGLEQALEGRAAGAELEVSLEPEEAYGEYDLEGLVTVPRAELPEDVAKGDWIAVSVEADEAGETGEAGTEDVDEEREMELRVVEVGDGEVVMDANHPLAGKRVAFRVRIVSVEPPT